MSNITRPDLNVESFASSALASERTVFGDTTSSDDLTANLNDLYKRGWGFLGSSDLPTFQDFNAAMYTMSQLNAYLFQKGVPEWNSAQEFHANSITNYNGGLYVSLQDNNINQSPETKTSYWKVLIKDGYYIPITGGTATGNITAPTLTATTLATIGGVAVTSSSGNLYAAGTQLLKRGDFGLGAATQNNTTGINIDSYNFRTGFYSGNNWAAKSTKLPFGTTSSNDWFYLLNQNLASAGSKYKLQILGGVSSNQLAFRNITNGVPSEFREIITTENIADYIILDVEYLYPNGTADAPMTISTSQELIINSPYSGKSVTFVPQIQSASNEGVMRWYDVPFYHENGYQWGVRVANDFPSLGSLYIRAGSYRLASNVSYSGYSEQYSPSKNLNSAPFRIKVIK